MVLGGEISHTSPLVDVSMRVMAHPRPVLRKAAQRKAAARGFSREFDFLLACCAQVSEQVAEHVTANERHTRLRSQPSPAMDWRGVLALAEYHGVIPCAYRAVGDTQDVLPPDTMNAFRRSYEASARKSIWFTAELQRVSQHFKVKGIAALAYKGPTLAQILFGDVTQRQFGDLDFLVAANDVPAGKAALLELDYRVALDLTERQEREYLKSGYEYTFDHALGRNLLELHWQVQPRFYAVDFDISEFFGRAIEVNIGGTPVRTLCPEDLLLVLCVHAAKHLWAQLSMLRDVAQLMRTARIDWSAVHERARRLGIERIVAITFILANKLLGVPGPVLAKDESSKDESSIEIVNRNILPVLASSAAHNTESIAYFRLAIRLRERWQDRVRFLWRLVSTPSAGEWDAIRLPDPLFPLYRPVRAGRLIRRMVTTGR